MDNYSEITRDVITTFVTMCTTHSQHKTLTSRVKPVVAPLSSKGFLELLEIDLMDFRNLPCDCSSPHTWAMNAIDHYTKYIQVYHLLNKTAEEVLQVLQKYCWSFGYPKKILCDNGKEFTNKLLVNFARENAITLVHGAPRTPTTQGLVERSNRTWKEDMYAVMNGEKISLNKWCQHTLHACYIMNISKHRAIGLSPYETLFGMKAHKETKKTESEIEPDKDEPVNNDEPPQKKKRKHIQENQKDYNKKMVLQAHKPKTLFMVGEAVAVKIPRPDKVTSLHPNMLIGQVTDISGEYVKMVTKLGLIKGWISFGRLTKCSNTFSKDELDYTREIAFSAACRGIVE